MRWLAIDHGTKKIGLAFSDELEILASPFEVWPQEEERTLDRLVRLCKEEGVQALAVGLPRLFGGAENPGFALRGGAPGGGAYPRPPGAPVKGGRRAGPGRGPAPPQG